MASFSWPGFSGGGSSMSSLTLTGSVSGFLVLTVPAVVTTYTLIFPAAQGGAGATLVNDGAGNLSWSTDPSDEVIATKILATSQLAVGSVDANSLLTVGGGVNPLSGSSEIGLNVAYTSNASNTSILGGVRVSLTQANAVTTTNAIGYRIGTTTVGAGSIITRVTDFLSTGAAVHSGTNNASFADGAVYTGNWFINQSGTDASTLGGALTVAGILLGSSQLAVGSVDANSLLTVGGGVNPLSGTSEIGLNVAYTSNASNTSTLGGVRVALSQAAGITTSNAVGYRIGVSVAGAGSIITRVTDFLSTGSAGHIGTNNASFADNVAFTGNWFINQAGSDASNFSGAVIMNAAVATPSYQTNSPINGATVTATANLPGILITPAAGIAGITLKLPSSPIDGQQWWVACSQAITTVTWQDSAGVGGNVVGGQATIGGANRGQSFVFSSGTSKWYAVN